MVCLSFVVVVRHGCIVAKRCEIGHWLLRSRTLAFNCYENHWPWMTLKGHNALWYANRTVLWLNDKS